MKLTQRLLLLACLVFASSKIIAQPSLTTASDSLILAQAFINLSLTEEYFDTLPLKRINKILPYEQNELLLIKNKTFKDENAIVYKMAWSMLYINKAKRLSKTNRSPGRSELQLWRRTLDSAYSYHNTIKLDDYYFTINATNGYNQLIGFKEEVFNRVGTDLYILNQLFTKYFNKDIYPDFKRLFYTAKNENKFHFDSLQYFAALHNIPIYYNFIKTEPTIKNRFNWIDLKPSTNQYASLPAINLIADYLEFAYLASNQVPNTININSRYLHDELKDFINRLKPLDKENFGSADKGIVKDDFYNRELNNEVISQLKKRLEKKFPPPLFDRDGDGISDHMDQEILQRDKYYFPNPAPFPSAKLFINNYKPALKTMKQVNDHLIPIFINAGYNGHLRYYYVKSGFAITTTLEKILKNGTPVTGAARWNISASGNGSFSLYQVFKSIFFETESNFRMLALVISPKQIDISNQPTSLTNMQDLIQYSYPSLPQDIENSVLNSKTLSILAYHFLQSDIGEVPMLETKNTLPVKTHLTNSKLSALLLP